MDILGYVLAIFMGLTLGMIGGGGSILTVPLLVYVFQVEPVLATAYSLFIVGLTALFGGISYQLKGEVDLKTGFIFAIPSFVGVYSVRAWAMPKIPDELSLLAGFTVSKSTLIMVVFAILMLLASISMIKSKRATTGKTDISKMTRFLLIGVEGLIVGGVTGFVGAGGGFLIIPALVLLVGLPMKLAVGTSLFIIAAKSLIGFIGDLQQSTAIDWPFILTITAMALIGLFFGSRLTQYVPEQKLKKGFGYFVLVMGSIILLDQLRGL
ncbi:MAG: sulfite exporter TauE/SafE family protein [Oligoflexus sp.]